MPQRNTSLSQSWCGAAAAGNSTVTFAYYKSLNATTNTTSTHAPACLPACLSFAYLSMKMMLIRLAGWLCAVRGEVCPFSASAQYSVQRHRRRRRVLRAVIQHITGHGKARQNRKTRQGEARRASRRNHATDERARGLLDCESQKLARGQRQARRQRRRRFCAAALVEMFLCCGLLLTALSLD